MKLINASILLMLCNHALAVDNSVYGTHWVKFQPTTVEGKLNGCSLTYLSVQADRVYKNGEPVIVNGGIWLSTTEKSIGLMLKVGLKDFGRSDSKFERPHFAYLKGKDQNTAAATISSVPGDEGYSLFMYNIANPAVQSVLSDLFGGQISIAFNRQSGGMDVVVPIDLFVVDSEYTTDFKVKRKTSTSTAVGFTDCTMKLIENLKSGVHFSSELNVVFSISKVKM
jgi:hypothetical protein